RNVVTPVAAIRARTTSSGSGTAKSTPNAPFSWMSTRPGTIHVPSGASATGSIAAIRSPSTTTRQGPSGSGARPGPRDSAGLRVEMLPTRGWRAGSGRGHARLDRWSGRRSRPVPPRARSPLGEQRPQVVVQEDAVRVELPPEGDEVGRARVAREQLVAGQVVELAPVHTGVELPEQ